MRPRSFRLLLGSASVGLCLACASAVPPSLTEPGTFRDERVAFSYPADWSVDVEDIQPFVRYTVETSGATRLWFDVYDFAEISGPEGLAEVVIFQMDQSFYGFAAFRAVGHPRPHWRELLGVSRRGVDVVCELVVLEEATVWDVHTWSAVDGERRSANVFLVGPREEEHLLGPGVDLVLGSLEWATP